MPARGPSQNEGRFAAVLFVKHATASPCNGGSVVWGRDTGAICVIYTAVTRIPPYQNSNPSRDLLTAVL